MSILQKIYDRLFTKTEQLQAENEEHRTSIRGQLAEGETVEETLPYSDAEQAIINRFENLPGGCKRNISRIQRGGPTNWTELSTLIAKHELGGHTHK